MNKAKSSKILIVDNFLNATNHRKLLEYVSKWYDAGFFIDALPLHKSTIQYRQNKDFLNFIIDDPLLTKPAYQILIEEIEKLQSSIEDTFKYNFSINSINSFEVMAANNKTHMPPHLEVSEFDSAGPQLLISYSFYNSPKKFSGGETFIWDHYIDEDNNIDLIHFPNTGSTVERLDNRLLVYEITSFHEFLPLVCESETFLDSCFFLSTKV
ncbi:MAG: hypothetical protein QNJ31_01770 [Candidatus Caenarcaniphilales bacterium]|nr:hypothetical protein [Candidatus Caenarcaniphilales bacterium]